MTERSQFDHRKKELTGAAFGFLANRGMSKKSTGLDGVAKKLIAKQAGEIPHDPELDHPPEWDRPVD